MTSLPDPLMPAFGQSPAPAGSSPTPTPGTTLDGEPRPDPGIESPPALSGSWQTAPRRLILRNVHTGERLNAVFWHDGVYDVAELGRINAFMRDWHSGEVTQIAVSLLNILWRLHIAARFTVPIEVLSGYRSRQTNGLLRDLLGESVAHGSFHIRAMAADIRMPGISTLALAHYANQLGLGGVGYYADGDFVHVDSGQHRVWVR
jgi:uncharacterized protein YcbK (DUF882 family)